MRKQIVAGNWKMNSSLDAGKQLANEVIENVGLINANHEVILIPPFIHLTEIARLLSTSDIKLGAQNCHQNESGAFTGEVSADMIKSTGATHVIVGHSERREYFSESDDLLASKVKLVLALGLTPIFCCGEKLESRESGEQDQIVEKQVENALFDLSEMEIKNVVIAYEPVWAIGTGKTATADQAQEMHAFIRSKLSARYSTDVAETISILYGGSVKPENAIEIFSKTDVDGGLIGGASLKSNDFIAIINALG